MQLLVLFQFSSYLSKLCNFNSDNPEIKCVPCTSFKKTDVRIVAVDYLDIVNDRRTISVAVSVRNVLTASVIF